MLRLIEYGDKNVFADLHDTSFVISIPVIFPCLLRQGTLVAPKNAFEAGYPAELLEEKKISCLITVPSLIERLMIQRTSGQFDCHIDCLIVCGEPCHVETMDFIIAKLKPTSIYNFYGSTEVAPWIFYFDVINEPIDRKISSFIPIGKPIDPDNIKISEEGELFVKGPQVSPGYLNINHDDKFFIKDGENWFDMGDLVKQEGKQFYCIGRKDNQVKINGYRIDLLEIEGQLQSFKEIDAAMCIISKNKFTNYITAVI